MRCRHAGAALDALPANVDEAARALRTAVAGQAAEPLDAFHGLRLDNDFDSTRTGATERPMGLCWSDVLYFELFNRSQFEAHLQQGLSLRDRAARRPRRLSFLARALPRARARTPRASIELDLSLIYNP